MKALFLKFYLITWIQNSFQVVQMTNNIYKQRRTKRKLEKHSESADLRQCAACSTGRAGSSLTGALSEISFGPPYQSPQHQTLSSSYHYRSAMVVLKPHLGSKLKSLEGVHWIVRVLFSLFFFTLTIINTKKISLVKTVLICLSKVNIDFK